MNYRKPYLKVFYTLKYFLILSFLMGQEENIIMSSDWIDVHGRSSEGVKVILREETRKIDIYFVEEIDEAVNNIEIENDERTTLFNSAKANLRANLNLAIDEKNALAMTVNDLKYEAASKRTELMNYRQKISDADSSIANSTQLIQEEKERVQDELTKIPFYEVLIGKFENLPPRESPIPYEDAIASKISREAINAQLGVDIMKKTIIQNGILSEENIVTLLKGKANTNLTRYEDQRYVLDKEKKKRAIYDLYRYGLVAVYPFQEDFVDLTKTKASKIHVDVEAVTLAGKGLSEVLDRDNKKLLSNMISDKMLKNSDSEAQVRRLARTAKQVIRRENGKIKASKGIIARNREKIISEEPLLQGLELQLQDDLQEQRAANNSFIINQNAWNSHVASEEYVRVFAGVGQATATEEKESRFAEIAANTYEDFITSIKSEYLKEETELTEVTLSEIKESKKSDIKLNSIKIVGKFSERKFGRINLITYVAYNFGFAFEQVTDSQFTDTKAPTITTPSRPTYVKPTPSIYYNLTVTTSPSGALVKSGRKTLGTTPLQTYLEPGFHNLVVTKDGYKTAMDVIEVNSSGVVLDSPESHFVLQGEVKKEFNKIYLWGGLAVLGGGAAIYLMSQDEQQAKETGSVTITIEIP